MFLAAGILSAIYLPYLLSVSASLIALGLLVAVYFLLFFFTEIRIVKLMGGLVGLLAVFLVGFIHIKQNTESVRPDHLLRLQNIIAYQAVVRSAPEPKAKSWKLEVEVLSVKTDHWRKASGKVLLYISRDTTQQVPWLYGDNLLIKGSPRELTSPANPGEFDFRRFLSFKNIFHQQFVRADKIQFLHEASRKGFIYYSHQVRYWATQVIHSYIKGDREQAVAEALILGVTDGIDTDLQDAYAASGAMHVLAVSGLHVGIIYAILLFLLRPLNSYSWSRWVVAGISIFLLWAFAFITGLSPSVLRAVTMFSFVALARPLGWRTNIYNTLAASAFVLLIYNPFLIMSVGFQLSYLAVLGIVYLQRPIYNLWEIENRVGDWVWQITCISIAAQIATFPLGMLYFHQFPVYFLVSNLFVIPLSTLVLVGGILLLLISPIKVFSIGVGYGIQLLIEWLNWLVKEVETWPFSLIQNIPLTTFQSWLVMGILILIAFTFQYRSIKPLFATLVVSLCYIGTQVTFAMNTEQDQFVVYNISKHSALEFMSNGVSYFETDSILLNDAERTRFHIRPNRLLQGVEYVYTNIPFKREPEPGIELYVWKGIRVARVRTNLVPEVTGIDFLVISQNAIKNPADVSKNKFKKIILDGSNSTPYVARWQQWAHEYDLSMHAVSRDGAFIFIQ